MGFLAKRAVAHSTGFKALANAVHRLYLFDRNGQALGRKGQHTAQILIGKSAAVQFVGKALKHTVIVLTAGLLQSKNRLRVKHMALAAAAPLVNAARFVAAQV